MADPVVVAGAGIAGTAAAYAAATRGSDVRLFDPALGSSCLWGGAVDDRPWEQVARASEVLDAAPLAGPVPLQVEAFVDALGVWEMPPAGRPLVRLATEAGRVRAARGREAGLLDLSALPVGARIVLPRIVRDEWDAVALARSLTADGYARVRRLRFEPVDAKLLLMVGEERIGATDLARRHDAPHRLRWLLERLHEMLRRERDEGRQVDAVLMGAWLGVDVPRAAEISDALGVAVGEIMAGMGNAAGMRFEAARNRLLSSLGVTRERQAVRSVERRGESLRVFPAEDDPFDARAVVLAIGGLAGGGVLYDPPECHTPDDGPAAGRAAFGLSVDAPVSLRAQGEPLAIVSSSHGPALDDTAWPSDPDPGLLEAVGIACDGPGAAPGIYAAGDVVADRPRTRLQAVFSGLRAGAAAAGQPLAEE
ncbi:MAG: FAD-dependent oxidoreductase [Deltaproteobacteria bacterium]|jgi:glycerol-3-phosphate dehydrogenase subunit B|nr:FAD-dependent oxidoreductase [Deltaproteobacteria bacterium]MBW2532501.1 FAD-dependent oxidoreductase [Deltaproteobacteria bacterium]